MRFEHPSLVWYSLVALPGLAFFLWWAWRKKQWLISQFVQSRLLANLTVGLSPSRQKIRLGLLVAAVGLLCIALARPQWGYDWEEARQRGLDIIVAVDTSRSMLAKDVSPNRLERAKLAALDLVRLARSDRLGLIAFAGGAFLQCPLTVDDGAFQQSLNALDTSIIPQGGTALAEAIRAALSAFEDKSDNFKILVMFTDGEDHDGHALEAARQAEKDGLRVFTVGVGTANGELLAIPNQQGTTDYLKDEQGNVVKSRLNESLLQQVAQATGGFYMLLTGANTIDLLYERGLAPLPKAEFASRQIKRYHERYQWFLGLAMILLLVEMFMPERKRVLRSETILTGSANQALRRSVGLLLCLCLPTSLLASSSQALKHYHQGRYEAARLQFERLLEKSPHDPRLQFNAGDAAYQAGDFEAAAQHFQSALVTQDVALQQGAYYNLGNTQYRIGESATDLQEKQNAWNQAVTHYESALKLHPQDPDAQFNLEFIRKKLEELQEQKPGSDGRTELQPAQPIPGRKTKARQTKPAGVHPGIAPKTRAAGRLIPAQRT
jgi:Ca-activated chloride channel family protein